MLGHHYTRSFLETAVAAVNAGCNLELSYGMRNNVFMHIVQALAAGNITLEVSPDGDVGCSQPSAPELLLYFLQMLRARVRPLFYTRLRLGEFDPPAMNPYSALGLRDVQSPAHQALALEAAIKSFVLLKNERDTLPLWDLGDRRIAVSAGHEASKRGPPLHAQPLSASQIVGPFADNPRVLFGDYAPIPEPQYIYTPRRGLEMLAANVSFVAGCKEPRCQDYVPAEVEAAVQGADVVVVCLGTGIDLETEAKDREDLSLPGHQLQLLQDATR
ncbi:XYL2 arabinofuranosidase, partial [Eudromia elegans]|nr:XYL2 arabinofuranosidase [Eudromia elegans]